MHTFIKRRNMCQFWWGKGPRTGHPQNNAFQEASRRHPKPAKAILKLLILRGATLHKNEEYVPILLGKRTWNHICQNNAFKEGSRRHPKPAKAILKLLILGGATLHKMKEYVPILLGKRTSNRILRNNAFQEATRRYQSQPKPSWSFRSWVVQPFLK